MFVHDPDCAEAFESIPESALPEHVLDFAALDAAAQGRSEADPQVTATLPASTEAFYIFTSGTTGLPKASVMSHNRWLASLSGIGGLAVRLRASDTMYVPLPLYHNNALSVSLSSVLASGACIAIGKHFSASKFWDDVILNRATAFCYIGELCRYLLAQPEKPTDRAHSVRLVVGNGMRPDIWDEFRERFGIDRIVEFYGASELNLVFVNAFSASRTAGFCPLPYAIVEYDEDGKPKRNADGRLTKVKRGGTGLLISGINDRVPIDGYTDPEETEKKIVRDASRTATPGSTPVISFVTRASAISPSSTDSATRSAGRARTSRPPRSRPGSTATRRSRSRWSSASRSRAPTARPEWRR